MSHQYPTIKTVDELRAFMESVIGEVVTDANLIWFVCVCNARLVSETCSIKDMAALFSEGVAKIDKLSDVQAYLDTVYEEFTEDNAVQNEINALTLILWILDFYYKADEWAKVLELIEQLGKE
jgi:hypothetical protein